MDPTSFYQLLVGKVLLWPKRPSFIRRTIRENPKRQHCYRAFVPPYTVAVVSIVLIETGGIVSLGIRPQSVPQHHKPSSQYHEARCLQEGVRELSRRIVLTQGPLVYLPTKQAHQWVSDYLLLVQNCRTEPSVQTVEQLQKDSRVLSSLEWLHWCQHYPDRPVKWRRYSVGRYPQFGQVLREGVSNNTNKLTLWESIHK